MPHITKQKALVILLVLIVIGTAARFWQLDHWMHYQLDQARDYRVIHSAVERGMGELPLQGPKAAGKVHVEDGVLAGDRNTTTLRLGPLFYYLEYVSARIFGNTPVGHITLITLLSVLTMPLFYLFVREYFTRYLSLVLTSMLSISLYFVVYSRFGWNPNLIPFFSLGLSYALLRASRSERWGGLWLTIAAVSFAFLSNMHFLAFTIVPVICIFYLLLIRPRIRWYWWIIALSVFIALNTPLILNDMMTGGENAKAFAASLTEERGSTHTLSEKISKNISVHATYFTLVVTSFQGVDFPSWKDGTFGCSATCNKASIAIGFLVGAFTLLALFQWSFSLYSVQSDKHRNFLVFTFLWIFFVFLFFTPLAFDFAPRFFLLQAPFFIILCGFALHGLYRLRSTSSYRIVLTIIAFIFTFHIWALVTYFWELTTAAEQETFTLGYTDRVLGEKTRVTLGQMDIIVNTLVAESESIGVPILLEAQAEFKRAFWERITHHPDYPYDGVADLRTSYKDGLHYLILRSQSDQENHLAKYEKLYKIGEKKTYGTLTLYKLNPRSYRAQVGSPQFSIRADPQFSSSAQVRYLWRQFFSGCRYNYTKRTCE